MTLARFSRTLAADLSAGRKPGENRLIVLLPQLLTIRGAATLLLRVSQVVGHWLPPLGLALKQINHVITGADIAWQASIGPGLALFHPTGVVIGPFCQLGSNVAVQQGVTLGGDGGPEAGNGESPTIGDSVLLGAGCRVIGKVVVGAHARIGANAVVLQDVPEGATVVGVPARIVRSC